MDESLARSACRVFGHSWGRPKYAAYRAVSSRGFGAGALRIRRQRTCTRCGNVEALER